MRMVRKNWLASGRAGRITRRGFIVSGLALMATAAAGQTAAAAASGLPTTLNGQARVNLNVKGVTIATFDEMKGIASEIEPIDSMGGDGPDTSRHIKQVGGKIKPLTVTLTRGRTQSLALWHWHEQAQSGALAARRDAKLVVIDGYGAVVRKYTLINAWPSKIEIGAMKAGSTEQVMETVTLMAERIEDDG